MATYADELKTFLDQNCGACCLDEDQDLNMVVSAVIDFLETHGRPSMYDTPDEPPVTGMEAVFDWCKGESVRVYFGAQDHLAGVLQHDAERQVWFIENDGMQHYFESYQVVRCSVATP